MIGQHPPSPNVPDVPACTLGNDIVCKGNVVSKDRRRRTFQTSVALILAVATLTVVGLMSILFNAYGAEQEDVQLQRQRRGEGLPDGTGVDFASSSSCGEIFEATSPDEPEARCNFARTCNQGDGIFLSFTFCHTLKPQSWCLLLSPFLILWLVLLFRMLGSTAEDYFSPSLEMFSLKMGLPPRFAAVSLLALGNGAPDTAAAINAMVADPNNGYKLILGALTGAGMFVGTVVAGSIILVTDGIKCRGALVRDVLVYFLAVSIVCLQLQTGSIGKRAVGIFFGTYFAYVGIVLVADVYHRFIHVPRMKAKAEKKKLERMAGQWGASSIQNEIEADTVVNTDSSGSNLSTLSLAQNGTDAETSVPGQVQSNGVSPRASGSDSKGRDGPDHDRTRRPTASVSRLIESFSNYRPDSIIIDRPIKLHGPDGVLADQNGHRHGAHEHHTHGSAGPYSILMHNLDGIQDIDDDDVSFDDLAPGRNWSIAIQEGSQELREHSKELLDDIFKNDDIGRLDMLLLACELPFTILRKLTVTIPSEGYYCRALVALSLALSPFWMAVYIPATSDISLLTEGRLLYFAIFCACSVTLGALVLRYADADILPLWVLIPTALYGFIIAAMWIDFIGAHLVRLLEYLGAVCRIPNQVMGLTVLAWGNSMGDLSTNVVMARKGLANMAMTACFAGPCFTLLCGLGSGFASVLRADKELSAVPVSLPPSIKAGIIFLLCNCLLLIVSGLSFYKGTITKAHSYMMFTLYGCYLATCIALQFM